MIISSPVVDIGPLLGKEILAYNTTLTKQVGIGLVSSFLFFLLDIVLFP